MNTRANTGNNAANVSEIAMLESMLAEQYRKICPSYDVVRNGGHCNGLCSPCKLSNAKKSAANTPYPAASPHVTTAAAGSSRWTT